MTFKIMAERCNQCLFGKDKIVSDARRAEILKEIRRKDSYFICHKAKDIACRGDFDQFGCGQMGRIAGRLRMIEFVEANSVSDDRTSVEEKSGGPVKQNLSDSEREGKR